LNFEAERPRDETIEAEELKELKELIESSKRTRSASSILSAGDLRFASKFWQEGGSRSGRAGTGAELAGAGRSGCGRAGSGGFADVSGLGGGASGSAEADDEASLQIVKSPIVGTFYESPSPGSPALL